MEKTVLLTLENDDYEVYDNGIFLTKVGWNKTELNMSRLQKENNLLRAELSKFE